MESVWSLKKNAADWRCNVMPNGQPRPGFLRVSTPNVGFECRAINAIGADVHTVFSDGKYFRNTTYIGNATITSDTKVCMTRLTAQIYNSGTGLWERLNAYYINTDTGNYFAGVASIASAAVAKANAPTAGASAAGVIPAGTYEYFITEVTSFGSESIISTSVSVTSATDFTVRITKGATVNSNAIYWRLYRTNKNESKDGGVFKVTTLPVATTYYDDNLIPENMQDTTMYNFGTDVVVPAGVRFSCIHEGVVACSGNSSEPNTVYLLDTSKPTDGMLAGYPDLGRVRSTIHVPGGSPVTALASMGRSLLVFTVNKVYEYFGLPWEDSYSGENVIEAGQGTDLFPKVLEHEGRVYYLSSDGQVACVVYRDETGSLKVTAVNTEPLHKGLFYFLSGTTQPTSKFKSLTDWHDASVWADPVNNRVYFGGEIKTSTYAGTWDAAALAAQPQLNRQYVYYVLQTQQPVGEMAGSMTVASDIPAKRACYVQTSISFADHQGVLYTGLADDVSCGTANDGFVTKTVTAGTTTTIAFTGVYAGTVAYGTPVLVINVSAGRMVLRYARSNTANSITVDLATVVYAGDIVMWGATVQDLWSAVFPRTMTIEDADFIIEPYSSRSVANIIGMVRRRGVIDPSWEFWAKLLPIGGEFSQVDVNVTGQALQLRFLMPCLVGSAPQALTYENVVLSGYPSKESW